MSSNSVDERRIDVLIVSPGVTMGHRVNVSLLEESIRQLGLTAESIVLTEEFGWRHPPWLPNTLGELFQAFVMRRQTKRVAREADVRSFIFGTSISTILQPREYVSRSAVHFDQPASINRRPVLDAPQRWLERRRLPRARLLMPKNAVTIPHVRARYDTEVLAMPPPVSRSDLSGVRHRRAICYGADPAKKGLDIIIRAWAAADAPSTELLVAGIDELVASRFLRARGVNVPPSVRWLGHLNRVDYRRTVADSLVFISGAAREEFGLALFEALADGALLVARRPVWPTDAFKVARLLDPRLAPVDQSIDALAGAISTAFAYTADEIGRYQRRAGQALEPYSYAKWHDRLLHEVIPRLLTTRPIETGL